MRLILSSIRFLPRSEFMPFVTAPDVCKFLLSLRAVPSSPLYFGVLRFLFLSWSYCLISFDSYVRRLAFSACPFISSYKTTSTL